MCIYLAEDTINKFREEVKAGKQKIKLDVLYEDENVIMVNKTMGEFCHRNQNQKDISINDQIIPYAVNQGLISEKGIAGSKNHRFVTDWTAIQQESSFVGFYRRITDDGRNAKTS